ncbi:MAG: NUDIX domain-containing protein [Candidatus Saccharimonadales bacterium]
MHDEARRTQANVGAVHVWAWCRNQDGAIDVFLQRRSQHVKDYAGLLDISFAGHIDAGETPLQAAKREAKEEVGYDIDVSRLVYIFGYRNFGNGTKWEYLYQVESDVTFVFDDGEVSEMKRIPLEQFIAMTYAPESNELVPHQPEYYSFLVKALQRYSENH